ncbi:MAG: phospholipase D family protein [Gammaproteobacteria bacterium]|nr:phospholipase D family protein [Gammaproteobacteria bacterium]
MKKIMLGIMLILLSRMVLADDISVCFTPGQNCTQQIVDVIDNTQKILLIQAYQFTSPSISKAVVLAKHRGVDVKLILDKSQYSQGKYCSALFFAHEGVPVWIDYRPNIAHNKIMVSDNTKIVTGSFNFSKNAQAHNAENMLIITNPQLASKYTRNFDRRLGASVPLDAYYPSRKHKHRRLSVTL